jgi:hypothetical protein
MAFVSKNWSTVAASKSGASPAMYSYSSSTDNQAAIAGSGYFNTVFFNDTATTEIYTYGSDGGQILIATNTAGVITTAVLV